MSKDLEETLRESTDDLASLVTALRGSPQLHVAGGFRARVLDGIRRERERATWRRRFLSPAFALPAAACLVALLAAASVFTRSAPTSSMARLVSCQRADGTFSDSGAAPYVQAFAVTVLAADPSANRSALTQAVRALVQSQDASGGWNNAALSARNVAALSAAARAGVEQARQAYRRGVRYLHMHGIGEISVSALASEARELLPRLRDWPGDNLANIVALCARGS